MYSPNSTSILSSIDQSSSHSPFHQHCHQPATQVHHHPHHHAHHHFHSSQRRASLSQCLQFKYFTTFLICTTCLALLSASLATHKWLVSKPIRLLRLNGNQTANLTSLMLTAKMLDSEDSHQQFRSSPSASSFINSDSGRHLPAALLSGLNSDLLASISESGQSNSNQQNNKFQGEIYFGLFQGVKKLNYGFGDRISHISVIQNLFAKDNANQPTTGQELINFRFWLLTVASVVLAILFALIGSIIAIINFVMIPEGLLTGPIGLVIYNSVASFSCLLAVIAWFIEFYLRLKLNVLNPEEVQNGWTSENRSQFGYSFYLVVVAFVLHLVNIFIISLVQFEQWSQSSRISTSSDFGISKNSTASRLSKSRQQHQQICEGVIMLY